MCGIAGIFIRDSRSHVDPHVIRDMTDTMIHRGPDESDYFIDGPVALGHRRLSIIDLGTGKQPIYNEDRSMAIVFNGEIYNYKDLKEELETRGHRFKTSSDTEVIIHAYEEWGENSPRRLLGMFSYAIWDSGAKRLFLARDRIGKKPLYYLDNPRYFIFASEVKAILKFPSLHKRISLEALSDYLSFQYVPSPKCIFTGINKLSPSHSIMVGPEGCKINEYWDVRFHEGKARSEVEWADELAGAISEAVSCRLESDVPLGAFLSGGIDSSVVVGRMARLLDRPVDTVSIGFKEEKFDELPYARDIARIFNTNHNEFIVDTIDDSIVEKLAWFFDEPFADSSSVPTYHVSRIARQNLTVVLSGDGGDENFAGYRRYHFDLLENRIRALMPLRARRVLFGTAGNLYPKGDWLPRSLRAKTLLLNVSMTPERGYFRTRSTFQSELKDELFREELKEKLREYDSFSVFEPYFKKAETTDHLSRIQYVDIKTYLPDDILVKVDRASMANSLEVRAPLLDHRLVELAASMPSRMKLKGGTSKYIFKLAAKNILPDSLIGRPKMGFSVPLDQWFKTKFKHMAMEYLLAPNARLNRYFKPNVISKMWDQHQKGWKNYGTQLWTLMTFEAWHRRHLG